jgi:hypothetical protein
MNPRTLTSVAGVAFAAALSQSALARPELYPDSDPITIAVSGMLEERAVEPTLRQAHALQVTSIDTVTGSLSGPAASSVNARAAGQRSTLVVTRVVFTSDGQLFLSETGERSGSSIRALARISGGTGIYERATGQLLLDGTVVEGGAVRYRYVGTITFAE